MSQPLIEVKHLSKSFDGHKVLDDINLTIDSGDVYGILGLSGAGKSTLVRCINGLETFEEGEIYFDGELLCSPNKEIEREKRKKLGMIFQSFNLLEQKNVLKNVIVACELAGIPKKERKEKALDAINKVGLSEKIKSYPSELSGGQQQRVAIARTLVMSPKVILSDEATSALDPDTTTSILSLLKKLSKEMNLTIIMISHQLEAIEQICDKVAILDKAKVVEKGSLDEVFLSPKSEMGKRLVYSSHINSDVENNKFIRILFDGNTDEPIIAELVSTCHVLISIVYASTKTQEGKAYGQTVIKMPKNETDKKKIESYLTLKGIKFEEVDTL